MCSWPHLRSLRLICYENGEFRAERHLAVALSLPAEDPAQAPNGEEQCVGVLAREHTLAAKYEQNRPPAVWPCPCSHGSVRCGLDAPMLPHKAPRTSSPVSPRPGCSWESPVMLIRRHKFVSPAPPWILSSLVWLWARRSMYLSRSLIVLMQVV